MKKIKILILICLFCVGCDAKYELNINDDLSVNENIVGLETDTFYNNYYKSSKERVIDFVSETKKEYLNEVGYSKEIVDIDNMTGAKFSKTFSNLEEYFEKSEAYTQFYENWDYNIKNGVVTIKLENQLLKNDNSLTRYAIDNCTISITLPFEVKKNNADVVDASTNTYTWRLNNVDAKEIYIKFDTNKEANYKKNNYISYLLIIGISIFVISNFCKF